MIKSRGSMRLLMRPSNDLSQEHPLRNWLLLHLWSFKEKWPGTDGLFLAARTSAPGGGGRYGLFYIGVPYATGPGLSSSQWLYGLRQDAENRTNLALLGTDPFIGPSPSVFRIELFDGSTGTKVNTVEGITLNAGKWVQFDSILTQYAPGMTQGYARVSGPNYPFITYAVINDGGKPGQRTGDGAFISSVP